MHVGSFSVENMSGFLGGLTTGATRTKPLEELPKIVSVEVRPEKETVRGCVRERVERGSIFSNGFNHS